MKRRDFLKFGGCGLAAVAVGGAGGWSLFRAGAVAHAGTIAIDLTMVEVDAEMVDTVEVPMWAYSTTLQAGGIPLGARIPGPVIFATEGDTLRVRVENQIDKGGAHGFAIPGVVDTGPLAFQQVVEVEFAAPTAGTYLYFDPQNAPVNRVMGLHGALVVLPNPVSSNTPYSNPTANVQRLFADLGVAPHFPGHPWDFDRNAIWIFNTVDPDKNAAAANHDTGIAPAVFAPAAGPARYLPQYFTINGKSGFFAAQHGEQGDAHDHTRSPDAQENISIHGNVGQPCLIRSLNAGMMWHSPHIHGNHVYLLADTGTVQENLHLVDTWSMPPLVRKDVLLPFIQPPDIPPAAWPPQQERFPLLFPMHDHQELSNTAAGANYPQGLVTHFQFDGVVNPADEVITVTRAEFRLKTGQLFLAGRSSGSPGNEMDIHAGSEPTPQNRIGSAIVAGDGTWTFRGRALKALGSRRISVHNHATGAERRAVPLKLI